jgi:HSP20 family protein
MTYVKFNHPAVKTLDSFLSNILNEVPSPDRYREQSNGFNFPPVNISETKDLYELEFNVPGRNKEDFKITVDKNILSVSFDKKEEVKDENKKQVKKEFTLQSFKRSFTLDEKIVSENIAAKYENGLLVLSLPKKEEVKVEAKQIAVN